MSRKNALRAAFLGLAVVLLVLAVVRERAALADAWSALGWGRVAVSGVLVLLGLGAQMLSWRALFAGSEVGVLPLRTAGRIYYLGQLGKYVPGSVWAVAAQADLGRDHRVPRTRSAVVAVAALVVLLVVGVVVGFLGLALAAPEGLAAYWWAALLVPAGVTVLAPPVLRRLLALAMRVLRRPGTVPALTTGGIVRSASWALVMWLAFGLHAWVLAAGLRPDSTRLALAVVGAYALAWVVGFLVVLAPAGAGAREVALVLLTASVLPGPDALVVALVSRALMVLGDALVASVFARPVRAAGVPADDTREPGQQG